MAFISETLQMRRLTESGVNIKTTYIVDGTLRYRSTDGTCQDDVYSGIRCRKEYFRQGKLLHTEKIFDSRMEYTYVSGMDEEAQHTCENCGFTGKVKEFVNGCPCCDAASNIDYADKELGSKHHYDLVLQSPVYRIVTGVVDYIVSFLLCSLWIINTSRTFNGYDVGKIFIYSTILAMILYYFFYLCDAYAVLGPVRRYKEKQNRRQQEFWTGTGIDKKRFYNNLNYADATIPGRMSLITTLWTIPVCRSMWRMAYCAWMWSCRSDWCICEVAGSHLHIRRIPSPSVTTTES